jgi:hypothetical protein
MIWGIGLVGLAFIVRQSVGPWIPLMGGPGDFPERVFLEPLVDPGRFAGWVNRGVVGLFWLGGGVLVTGLGMFVAGVVRTRAEPRWVLEEATEPRELAGEWDSRPREGQMT